MILRLSSRDVEWKQLALRHCFNKFKRGSYLCIIADCLMIEGVASGLCSVPRDPCIDPDLSHQSAPVKARPSSPCENCLITWGCWFRGGRGLNTCQSANTSRVFMITQVEIPGGMHCILRASHLALQSLPPALPYPASPFGTHHLSLCDNPTHLFILWASL